MGLAVYNSTILDIHFPPCCYKKLLFSSSFSSSSSGSRTSSIANRGGSGNGSGHAKTPEVYSRTSSNDSFVLTLHDLSEVMPVSSRSVTRIVLGNTI